MRILAPPKPGETICETIPINRLDTCLHIWRWRPRCFGNNRDGEAFVYIRDHDLHTSFAYLIAAPSIPCAFATYTAPCLSNEHFYSRFYCTRFRYLCNFSEFNNRYIKSLCICCR